MVAVAVGCKKSKNGENIMNGKKSKALYKAARAALSKISGNTLLQYVDEDKERKNQETLEEYAKGITALQAELALKQDAQEKEQGLKVVPLSGAKAQSGETPVQQLSHKTLGKLPPPFPINEIALERRNRQAQDKDKEETQESKVDYQATLKVIQALASITLDMLSEMEIN